MPSHPVAVPRTFSFQPRTASHLHAQPSHAYPHRRRRRLWNLCQTLATYFLILLVLVCLLASLVDIGDSFVRSNRTSKVADLSITFGTYVAIVRRVLPCVRWLRQAPSDIEGAFDSCCSACRSSSA